MTVYTSRQHKIGLSVPGVSLPTASWSKFSGADREAETSQFNAGGMAPAAAVDGLSKRNNATLEIEDNDATVLLRTVLDGIVHLPCSVGVTPLASATANAAPQNTYTGIVKSVKFPDYDSTSSAVRMITVVLELNEPMS